MSIPTPLQSTASISRSFTAFYTVEQGERVVRVAKVMTTERAHGVLAQVK